MGEYFINGPNDIAWFVNGVKNVVVCFKGTCTEHQLASLTVHEIEDDHCYYR